MQPDVLGRTVRTYAPENQQTVYTYDTLSRLVSKTSPDAGTTEYKYDRAGNVRFSRDARQTASGKVLFTSYDFANRALTTGEATATWSTLDPNVSQAFESTQGNWLRVNYFDKKPPTTVHPWSLAAFATEITNFSASNLMGRLAATAERSNGKWLVTLYSYDVRWRVATKVILTEDLPAASKATYTYTYDRQDQLTTLRATVGSLTHNQWYDYDNLGNLWKVFVTGSSTKPATQQVTYAYWPTGRVSSMALLGGTTIPYKYTIRDWTDSIDDVVSPSKSFGAKYLYFANGNVQESEFHQTLSPAATKRYRYRYTYDDLNRLTLSDYWSFSGTWANVDAFDEKGLTYDKNGNVKTLQRHRETGTLLDNLTYTFTSGTNRLTSVTDAVSATPETWDAETGTFTYDQSGNVLTSPAPYSITATTYDWRNLPLSFTRSGTTTQYRYNEAGQRYYRKVGTSAAEYYAQDGAATIGIFTETGTLLHWNILAGGTVIGRRQSTGANRYYVKDHLGSTRMVVNTSGTVLETQDYYAWGLQMPGRSMVSGASAREKFTGKERDAETALDYFGARYYMPVYGRWTSVDPLESEFPAWSPYAYSYNNPLRFIDPDGMAPRPVGCPRCNPLNRVEGFWNYTVGRVSEAGRDIGHEVTSAARYVAMEGPGWADAVSEAAIIGATGMGLAAVLDPEPASKAVATKLTGGLAVASLFADMVGTGLALTDAILFDGSIDEVHRRAVSTSLNMTAARIGVGIIRNFEMLRGPAQERAAAASGGAASVILQDALMKAGKDDDN